MSFTPAQAREMISRTEKKRKAFTREEKKLRKHFNEHDEEPKLPKVKIQRKKESGSLKIMLALWESEGVPSPKVEFQFCERKWKMDFAWPFHRLYLEVQGGIWGTGPKCKVCGQRQAGRHTRGKALLDEWEKIAEATIMGWRPLFCQPVDLLTVKLCKKILRALA